MKNIKIAFTMLSFTMASFFGTTDAQTVLEKYDKETIYLSSGINYIKNGESHWVGFFTNNLKKEMEVSPNAVIEYKKFSNKRNVAFGLVGVGFAAMIAGLSNYDENDGWNALMFGGYVSVVGGMAVGLSSQRHLAKAIWVRNRDVLK